jgi:hypothetical protein
MYQQSNKSASSRSQAYTALQSISGRISTAAAEPCRGQTFPHQTAPGNEVNEGDDPDSEPTGITASKVKDSEWKPRSFTAMRVVHEDFSVHRPVCFYIVSG